MCAWVSPGIFSKFRDYALLDGQVSSSRCRRHTMWRKPPRGASSRCRHICLARVTNPNGFVAAIFRSAGHFECHFVYTTVSFEPRNSRNATRTCRVSKNYNSNFAAFKMLLMLSLTKNIILSERFFNEGYFSLEKLMNFIF